jgi:RNA-directed DNA polymerase
MMHGHEKSDPAIVAAKPANKANEPTVEASAEANAAEPAERRAGTKGNADQQSTCRAQDRISVEQAVLARAHPGPRRLEPQMVTVLLGVCCNYKCGNYAPVVSK